MFLAFVLCLVLQPQGDRIERQVVDVDLPFKISSWAPTSDPSSLVVVGSDLRRIACVSVTEAKVLREKTLDFAPAAIAVCGSVGAVAVKGAPELRVLRLSDFSEMRRITLVSPVESMAASPAASDTYVYAVVGYVGLWRIDVESGRAEYLMNCGNRPALGPDGRCFCGPAGLVDARSLIGLHDGRIRQGFQFPSFVDWASDGLRCFEGDAVKDRSGLRVLERYPYSRVLAERGKHYFVVAERAGEHMANLTRATFRRLDTLEAIAHIDLSGLHAMPTTGLVLAAGRIVVIEHGGAKVRIVAPVSEPRAESSLALRHGPPLLLRPGEHLGWEIQPVDDSIKSVRIAKFAGPPGARVDATGRKIEWEPPETDFISGKGPASFCVSLATGQRQATYEFEIALVPDVMDLLPMPYVAPGKGIGEAETMSYPVRFAEWSRERRRLALGSVEPPGLLVVDAVDWRSSMISLPRAPASMAVLGDRAYLTLEQTKELYVVDLLQAKIAKKLAHKDDQPLAVAAEPTRGLVYLAVRQGEETKIAVFDPATLSFKAMVKELKGEQPFKIPIGGGALVPGTFTYSLDGELCRAGRAWYPVSKDGLRLGPPDYERPSPAWTAKPWGCPHPIPPLFHDPKLCHTIVGTSVFSNDFTKKVNELGGELLYQGPPGYNIVCGRRGGWLPPASHEPAVLNFLSADEFVRVASVATPLPRNEINGAFTTARHLLVLRQNRLYRFPIAELLSVQCRTLRLDPEVASGVARRKADAEFERGRQLMQQGRSDEAKKAFEKAVQLDSLGRGILGLGEWCFSTGDLDGAAKYLRQAIEAGVGRWEDRARAYLALARVHRSRKEHRIALETLRQAWAIQPDFIDAHMQAIDIALETQDVEEAYRSFLRARAALKDASSLAQRGADIKEELLVSNVVVCPGCSGAKPTCDACGGAGSVARLPCETCLGTGRQVKHEEKVVDGVPLSVVAIVACKDCQGSSYNYVRKK